MERLISRIQWNAKASLVCSQQGAISYAQLDSMSDVWAHELYRYLGPDINTWPDVLPVVAKRSVEFVLATLACWKLGLGITPIAEGTPSTRLSHIVGELATQWVINTTSSPSNSGARDIYLQSLDYNNYQLPKFPYKQTGIAYIIYTSGSTGSPKGCIVGFESLLPVIDAFCNYYHIRQDSRITFCANIAFDAAMLEWLPALVSGASFYIVDNEILMNPHELVRFYHKHQITFSWLPTPLAELLMMDASVVLPDSLETLQTAGQRLTKRPPNHWKTRVENAYGPTETTIIATSGEVLPGVSALPDIGKPLPGVYCYIVDEHLNLVPMGEEGELLITGIGISRGYLKQTELNKKHFVTFYSAEGKPLHGYRSGDRCRLNRDGNIEYLNRIDNQLKINGFRIESDEVIHHLLTIEGVKQAHVKVQCLGRRDVLVGYLVLNDPLLSESDIKMSLKEHLPEYMVPDYVLFLERFPLTPNFKLDEAQLPIPQTSKLQSSIIPVEGHALEFLKLFWTHMGVEIGWKDNFFHQGGNSIAAISIAADVYKKFGLGLPFEQFEKQGTPESIWNAINSHLFELTEIKTYLNDIEEYVDAPLSSSQRSIWFLANMDPFDRAYHAKARLMFHGSVDPEAVIYAIQKTVDRHSIFRTVFLAGNGEGIQRVYRTYDVSLQRFDFSSLDKAKSEQSLDELIQNGLNQPFVLFQLPLVRWALVKLSNDKHVLVHIEHHLVHDGWSYNLFLKDFTYYYRAYVENVFEERSLPAQYVDFCVTQEQWLKTAKTQQQLDYWQKRLDGVTGTLNLPKYVPDIGHAAPGKTLRIPLERSQWNAIEKLAEQRRETPFSIMLAAYYLTLSRFSGDKDVCVGSAFANRQWINADSIIGMMINTVVLRGQLTEDMTTHQLLMQSSKGVLEAQQHQSLPFEYLVTALNPEREPGVNPYFQVFFGFHDSPMPDSELPGISEIQVYEAIDSNAAKFDLSVVVIPREGQLGEGDPVHILWEFKTTKYPQWLIENMIQDYMQILQQISSGYTGCISEIPVQSTPIVGYDVEVTDDTVYQQFRRQAMRMPEHSALTCKGITYSFTMLLHLVEKKAAYLKNLGIVPGQFIGICLQRDANSIAWMLACQANGIGYIPLDPSYPAERINYIISHSQMKYLVAEREEFAAIRINPDAFSDDAWQPSAVDSTWPMYCIYTSGSTGLPKGVVISFAAFNNFIFAMAEQFRLQVGDRWLALTSFSFDISTLELYLPLVSGAEIVLAGQDENADAVALIDYLKNAQITHCQATPSTWRILTDMGWRPLRDQVILSGGEAIDVQLVNALSENGNRCYNMYGPTETTVWSSLKEVSFSDSDLSIGKPIANTQFYILDHNLNPVPHGAIGQLWIGGAGLANGYWDMDEYTKERFIQHPSNKQRIYQTGDLAYIDAQYEVHFCGRIDQQVKISGYRIELEEIEQVIKLLAEVKQVAVVVRDITDTAQLVAFVNAQCKEEDILAHCRAKLPAYMIPHRIVRLETLPLTPNKKVDKKALPTVIAADTIQYKPKTSTEHKLAAIFSHHLQLEQIDTHRHFYKLGGNSLLAMRVCFDIEKELNIHIRGIDLLELGSLSALASFIDSFYLNESDLEYIEEITL